MAITKLLSPNTPNPITAGPNGDWDLAMAQLTAVKKLLSGEQMMLTEWTNATTQPKLALGTHLQHKGSIYVVDTEDYALPALGGNGTYYIVLEPSGDTLVGSWATDLSGYSWDSTYNGLYNGGKLVLPYQIVVDGSDIVKRKILNPWIDGGFTTVDWMGNVRGASLVVNGNATVGGTLGVTGAISGATINTGGLGAFLIGQNLRTTDSPTFASINTGYGDNEVYKISNETIDFGSASADTTKQIGSMASGEIKFVQITGTLNKHSSNTYRAILNAPSGGTYLVLAGVPNSSATGIVVGGGATIWNIYNREDVSIDLASTTLIRRL